METNKSILWALGAVIVLGVILLGGSITGMVTSDYSKPICSVDADCSGDNVCCLFNEQESGVCNVPQMCDQITRLTREGAELSAVPAGENPNQENYLFGIILGFVIIGIASYAIIAPGVAGEEKLI